MAPDRDDDDLDDLGDPYDDDEDGEAPQTEVTIEITGLSLYTHHGVSAAEGEGCQRLGRHSRLWGGGWDARATRRSPPSSRTPSTTARCASASRSWPSSAATRRSSGCARPSPTACS